MKHPILTSIIVFVILIGALAGCATRKDVVYLQDVAPLMQMTVPTNYEMSIYRDDLLGISISSKDLELAGPFNLPLVSFQTGAVYNTQQRMLGYLVDINGDIDFPILGKLHAEGLTRLQLTNLIKNRLIKEDLIKDPIVTVQFLNFKISVMGEVNRPGEFSITSDRVTLLEAISMAGDLTIYGRRDRVAVIRERNGKQTILFHDLRSADMFQSPCYFLQQNDIVYVEPNSARAGQSSINQNNTVGVWMSAVGVLLTAVNVLVTLSRR
ncbi:MAG: polysaccharide biosynthesis/export family protein [Tannerellaceae bacterium]|jgi:polysaccharide export outer membrane protein|nr:polysaccharide biosynthesis/export family protein [Tannerellaceae bacterium]